MRRNRDLFTLILLLIVFIVGGIFLGGRGTGLARLPGQETAADPSIRNNRASGSKGLFEWVGKLGYQPVVWRQNWALLTPSVSGILLVVDPQVREPFATLTGSAGGEDDGNPTQLSAGDAVHLKQWLKIRDGTHGDFADLPAAERSDGNEARFRYPKIVRRCSGYHRTGSFPGDKSRGVFPASAGSRYRGHTQPA